MYMVLIFIAAIIVEARQIEKMKFDGNEIWSDLMEWKNT